MKKKIMTTLSTCALLFAFGGAAQLQAQLQGQTPESCLKSCADYGSYFTKSHQTVHAKCAILFDKETVCSHGISHKHETGDFRVLEDGIYRITYSVSVDEDCEGYWKTHTHKNVALTLDGHVIQGSEMHIEKHDHLSTLSIMVRLSNDPCRENILQLINNNEMGHHSHIKLRAGDGNCNVTAAIQFERVACLSLCNPCPCVKSIK